MIQVLVCALGKVLLPFDTEIVWRSLEPHFPGPPAAARRAVQDLFGRTGYGRGEISSALFHATLVSETGFTLPFEAFGRAWSDMFWLDPDTLALVSNAPASRKVLLSNTNDLHWQFIRGRFPEVLVPFDDLMVSHELGLEKPDQAIYRAVMERTGLPAEVHLFIDDAQENVSGAEAVGFRGHVHTGARELWGCFRTWGLADGDPPAAGATVAATPPSGALWSHAGVEDA